MAKTVIFEGRVRVEGEGHLVLEEDTGGGWGNLWRLGNYILARGDGWRDDKYNAGYEYPLGRVRITVEKLDD